MVNESIWVGEEGEATYVYYIEGMLYIGPIPPPEESSNKSMQVSKVDHITKTIYIEEVTKK